MKSSIQIQALCGLRLLLCLCSIACLCDAAERTMAPPEEPPAAKALFRQLVEAQKPDRALWAYMDAWLDETGFEHLRDYLHARIKAGEQTADELRSLALLCERLDETDDALAALTLAAKIAPGDDRIWLAGARILARRSDAEASFACIDKISPKAPSCITNEVVLILGLFTERGEKGKEALAMLEAISGNRWCDDNTRFQAAGWLARHSHRTALPVIEAGFSGAKIDQQREKWRLLLVSTSENDSQATRECLAGIEHSRSGSVEEGEFIDRLERLASYNRNSPVVPLAVAERFISRPAVVLAMKDAMRARDDKLGASAIAALLAKANPGDAFFRSQWIDALADAGKIEEAAPALRERVDTAPANDAARVQLALVLRDAGRREEGASALETWATSAGTDAARVRRVANLLPLFRSNEEARAWEARARKNLPAAEPTTTVLKPDQAAGRHADLAKEIKDAWIKTDSLMHAHLKMHRQLPGDEVVTLELSKEMREREYPVEHLHLALHQFYAATDRAALIRWWRTMGAETQATWASTGFRSAPTERDRLLNLRFDLGASAEYWVALGELMGGVRPEPYLEALRQAPDDVDARIGLIAALAQDLTWQREAKPTGHIRQIALPLMVGRAAGSTRLLLAEVDFHTMKNQAAERAIFELMDDPLLDEYQAERIALRLMEAGGWRSAAVFLHAQVSRLSEDWRLGYLYGIALKKCGDTGGAIDALLRLSTKHDFAWRYPVTVRSLSDNDFPLPEDAMPYERKSEIVGRLANALAPALDRGSRSALEHIGFISKPAVSLMLPTTRERAFYIMAHLVDAAQSLPSALRHDIASRAREAGLPVPLAIEFGRIVFHDSYAELLSDDPRGPDGLDDPAFAEFWLGAQLASRQAKTFKWNASANQIRWTQQCSRVLRDHDPDIALQAALTWWQNDPASSKARAAVLESIDLCPGKYALVDWSLAFTLEGLPFNVRREPTGATAMSAALDRWKKRLREAMPDSSLLNQASAVECHLLLGQWRSAIRIAEEISTAHAEFSLGRFNSPPEFTSIEHCSWPDQARYVDWRLVPGCFPPFSQRLKDPVLSDADKPAFRAALNDVQDRRLRVQWLLASGDEMSAADDVRAWVVEQPASVLAVQLAAALAMHDGERSHALDLLHTLAVSIGPEKKRKMASLAYLRAAVCGADENPKSSDQSFQFTPPPADHHEKAKAVALEVLPRLCRAAVLRREHWPRALQALDIDPELIREAVARSERRSSDVGSAVHWAEKQLEVLRR